MAISLTKLDAKLSRRLEDAIRSLQGQESRRLATTAQRSQRQTQLIRRFQDKELADRQLERVLGGNDLTDISYLAVGLRKARSVGRVVIRKDRRLSGYGTGFLVAPGVLMTNQHVLESAAMARESSVQFQYERNALGGDVEPVEFRFLADPPPIIDARLDMTLVAVEPVSANQRLLREFGWLPLNPDPGKAFIGEYLTIIQHPGGQRKQICVRENKLIAYQHASIHLWYQTDTVGGSSGSPVFNDGWDVVALHHKAIPKMTKSNGKDMMQAKNGKPWTPNMGDDEIEWLANEGIRISSILEFLGQGFPQHPFVRALRAAGAAPPSESLPAEYAAGDGGDQGGVRVIQRDGRTKVLVPVEIDMGLRVDPGIVAIAQGVPSPDSSEPDSATFDEKVEINTDNYAKRNGYQADFLGGGLKVPLPKVATTKFGSPLKITGNNTVLKYWNYSVVMNADRGLAFYSAANLKPKQRRGKQDGNAFIRDKRVDEIDDTAQVGRAFYKRQSEFELDRSQNPFDQGHLSRREDLQWGKDDAEAKRNGDDSFHYTNCAPQHFEFNQNKSANGLWNRLEVSALKQLSAGDRVCVINGPVFDAPRSKVGGDGRLRLQLNGPRKKDPVFGKVAIPKLYFKLIAYQKDGELRAKAFVVSQEDVLDTVDRLQDFEASTLSEAELSLYQVSIKDLEKLTGLKFGIPAAADTPALEEKALLVGGRRIEREDELFL